MNRDSTSYQHVFVSRTFSRFAEENEALIAAVIADDSAAVSATLDEIPEAILWLNPRKNQSILNEACSLALNATVNVILDHLTSRSDALLTKCVVNFCVDSGWTPLLNACHHGNAALVGRLVTMGADINAQNNQCWSSLTVATGEGFRDIAEFLLQQPSLDLKANLILLDANLFVGSLVYSFGLLA